MQTTKSITLTALAATTLSSDAFAFLQPSKSFGARFRVSSSSALVKDIEARAQKAKETWSTIALQPTNNIKSKCIPLKEGEDTTIHNHQLFSQFCKEVTGTYYINGLASCRIGDRLIHPFEAHGHCKSLVFDGSGNMHYTSNIIETPLTTSELAQNKIINRGVMSTVADMNNVWGYIRNALSSSERDTANLTADLWPLPSSHRLKMQMV